MSTRSKRTIEKKTAHRNGVARMLFALLSLVLELVFIVVLFFQLNEYVGWVHIATSVFALLLVLLIYGQHKSASLKMPWIMLILVMPVFGVVLFLLVGLSGSTRRMRRRYASVDEELMPLIPQNPEVTKALKSSDLKVARIAEYIRRNAGYPAWQNTDVTYYDDAAKGLDAQLSAMRTAQHYIFMEYHAIEDKESFHRILEILKQKVKEGVEVRIFYDDMGSIGFINTDFVKRMRELGIKCRVFNPFILGLNVFLNNRDHRKITVIDGSIGFTGGYNIANEYFNITHPYGHWKDTGIRLTGDAVRSLTVTFLEMWNAAKVKDEANDTDFAKYVNPPEEREPFAARQNAFVVPYADSPLTGEHVGENVYMSVAESASNYVWFITPYLILTGEMIHILGLAAKRGIDVRIITPGIPDKKLIYSVTRSYYNALVRSGVRIFEYTPGFCHAKMSVSDDRVATCGTINLDYRSLYHHFENGCLLHNCEAVLDIKRDFEALFPECREVTERYRTGRNQMLRLWQLILRLFAPLL